MKHLWCIDDDELAGWKIRGRGRQSLIWGISIQHNPCHFQSPAGVDLQVTMHEPNAWVVCSESNSDPTSTRNSNGVSLGRIHQIEVFRVSAWIVVPRALPNYEEIVSMKMEGMALWPNQTCILQNHLYGGVEGNHFEPRVVQSPRIVGWSARVIKRNWWIVWEIQLVYSFCLTKVVGLKKRSGRENEGYIVNGGCEFGSIGTLAFLPLGTWIQSQTNREEEVLINALRNSCWKLWCGQAS